MNPEIKICGLTNIDDALKALDLGADYLGFILYPQSPRFIDPIKLKSLSAQLPPNAKAVAVLVNTNSEYVIRLLDSVPLHAVQFHGDENLEDMPPLPVNIWKAVRVEPGDDILPSDAMLAERIVLDTSVKGYYGGTGCQIDLPTASRIAKNHKVMLAGGLNPGNVREAIRQVQPFGIDVSSGVEAKPGIKDYARLSAFISAVRS